MGSLFRYKCATVCKLLMIKSVLSLEMTYFEMFCSSPLLGCYCQSDVEACFSTFVYILFSSIKMPANSSWNALQIKPARIVSIRFGIFRHTRAKPDWKPFTK